jgi:hypothetical protein
MSGRCETFARLMAKEIGISYSEARKMYWRRTNNEVWVGSVGPIHTVRSHCVHCARADAMSKYPPKVVRQNGW